MGNRAIVLPKGSTTGVYLHWNGGPDSVKAFLEYCKLRRFRDFGGNNRDGYGLARFVQVVSNFFGGGLSIGIEENCEATESWASSLDNGIYVVDGWEIVEHIGCHYPEGYDLGEMLSLIDERQPESEQLGKEFLNANIVPISEVRLNNEVFIFRCDDHYEKHRVVGVAPTGTIINGHDVSNKPYVDLYSNDLGDYSWNINNYVSSYAIDGMIRVV